MNQFKEWLAIERARKTPGFRDIVESPKTNCEFKQMLCDLGLMLGIQNTDFMHYCRVAQLSDIQLPDSVIPGIRYLKKVDVVFQPSPSTRTVLIAAHDFDGVSLIAENPQVAVQQLGTVMIACIAQAKQGALGYVNPNGIFYMTCEIIKNRFTQSRAQYRAIAITPTRDNENRLTGVASVVYQQYH